jgi:chaperonin GroES
MASIPLPHPDTETVPVMVAPPAGAVQASARVPIRMLHDRVLVSVEGEAGERRSSAGIVIPATAAVGRRLAWAVVVAVGQHVRQVQVGDRVLYDPEDRAEVEVQGAPYILLRERDIHAVAAARVEDGQTGLYL